MNRESMLIWWDDDFIYVLFYHRANRDSMLIWCDGDFLRFQNVWFQSTAWTAAWWHEASSYKEKRSQSGRVCTDNHRARERESRVVQPQQSTSSTCWQNMMIPYNSFPGILPFPFSLRLQAMWRSPDPTWPAPSSVTRQPKHHIRCPSAAFRKDMRVWCDVFCFLTFSLQINLEWIIMHKEG